MTYSARTLAIISALLIGFIASTPHAQTLSRGKGIGQSGGGTDVWTTTMAGLGLFRAHRDNCNSSTEAFIKIYTNSNNIDFGFCIDKDEHSAGAIAWEDARQECLDESKRLPEPTEFKVACEQSATLGLNNMTDDGEWMTNFQIPMYPQTSARHGIAVVYGGYQGCNYANIGWVASHDKVVTGNGAFRCVR